MKQLSNRGVRAWAIGAMVSVVFCARVLAQQGAAGGEWRHYGGDLGSTKYAPLDQITASNFSTLRTAWRWDSADAELARADTSGAWRAPAARIFELLEREKPTRWAGGRRPSMSGLIATPLMVAGVLYMATALNQAAAIDARTGRTLWVYDPKAYESGAPPATSRPRGVAYWADGTTARILWGTGDGYLIAVDAKTGRPISDFGRNGRVDLLEGLPRASRDRGDGRSPVSSPAPPLVVRDTVIVGSAIEDFTQSKEMPPGWVRAYDVKTGKPRWHFNPIPQPGEFGHDTWLKDSWAYTGQANMWSAMSADEELGYVYLPLGSPTSDHYGGHRPGDGLFGDSLVCVDVATGKRVWHFQMIHHGIWDYDNVAAPNLLDITSAGRRIKAVAQINKNGFIYTFDQCGRSKSGRSPSTRTCRERSRHQRSRSPQSLRPSRRKGHQSTIWPTSPPRFDRRRSRWCRSSNWVPCTRRRRCRGR
jgi:quinoprotein glucose dehydrogenase